MRAGNAAKKSRAVPPQSKSLAAVAASRKKFQMDREDEGFTIYEYAQKFGISTATATYELDKLVEAGELIKGLARRPRSDGFSRRMNVYRAAK